ncbi:hypothetical protein RF11_13578 [Thelohanellus kitauei]|uniref:Uncharacterized protein n=1 Tax=Thelohanellus kitauei TaxID=669202 RepID=A0A0C2J5C9_THEKT|nr:hypothetical protein RF11_13578 [Thelohanellus kitauei]
MRYWQLVFLMKLCELKISNRLKPVHIPRFQQPRKPIKPNKPIIPFKPISTLPNEKAMKSVQRNAVPYCRDIGIPFPHGCIDFTKYSPKMKLQGIYLERADISTLLDDKSMKIPLGSMMNQLYVEESTYYLCGLDFITKNTTLTLRFQMNLNNKSANVEFCFRFFKDMYIYEEPENMPTILPAKYYHENVFIKKGRMSSLINIDKYTHIYSTIQKIETICADQADNAVFDAHGNEIETTYHLNRFDVIQTPDGLKFQKKDHRPLTCYVYVTWEDDYLKLQQTTVFQVTDLLELVKSFDRQKIVFNFGPYEKNYKLMIVSKGFTGSFCGSEILNIDEWCLENVDQNLSSPDRSLRDNTYSMPEHDNYFVVLTFTVCDSKSQISPVIRLLLSTTIFDGRFR